MVQSNPGYGSSNKLAEPSKNTVVKQNLWLGASWKILAFSCYAALNAIARFLSGGADSNLESHLPVNVIIFFQDLFALLIVAPWLVKHAGVWEKPRYIKLHLFRIIISAMAVITWYFAIYFLPLADAVAISIFGPLIGVIGAKIYLKEQFSMLRLFVLIATLVIAIVVIQPFVALSNQSENLYGLACVFISAVCFAMAKISTRKLASLGESRKLLTGYLLVFIVPVTLIPALFVWVTPTSEHILWLIGAGALTALALYAVSSALAYAEVSFLAPFDFFRFILNASIGFIAFTELPHLWAVWLLLAALLISVSLIRNRSAA